GRVDQARLAFDQIKLAYVNLLADHAAVTARVDAQCGRVNALAGLKSTRGDKSISLQSAMSSMNVLIDTMDRVMDIVANMASIGACTVGTSTNCPQAAVAGTSYAIASGVMTGVAGALGFANVGMENAMLQLELSQDV